MNLKANDSSIDNKAISQSLANDFPASLTDVYSIYLLEKLRQVIKLQLLLAISFNGDNERTICKILMVRFVETNGNWNLCEENSLAKLFQDKNNNWKGNLCFAEFRKLTSLSWVTIYMLLSHQLWMNTLALDCVCSLDNYLQVRTLKTCVYSIAISNYFCRVAYFTSYLSKNSPLERKAKVNNSFREKAATSILLLG